MAETARFYPVPEITLETPEGVAFTYLQEASRYMVKGAWAGDQLVGLAGTHPEDLPTCFVAVQAEALSPVTGWETEHGKWEPKKMHAAGPGLDMRSAEARIFGFTRTRLEFRPKDGSQSFLAMTMYSAINCDNNKAYLEEDVTFCLLSRLPNEKGKARSYAEELAVSHWRSLFGHVQPLDVSDYSNMEAIGIGVGGPKKRPRSKPVGGTLENEKPVDGTGSRAWNHFTKIYTKDPKVVYAACHHCGGMMKLKEGSNSGTSSLLKHHKICKVKRRLSESEAIAELELEMLGPECGRVTRVDNRFVDPIGSVSINAEFRSDCYA